ncbi:MAG: hypothetical protein WCK46_00400 [Candidatus Adlerbacteria bacterium]
MVLFFTTTLFVSIVGLLSLLAVKRWELKTGNVLFLARVRPTVGTMAHVFLLWVERVLPALAAHHGQRTVAVVRAWTHRTIARGVLAAERGLEHTLDTIRGATDHPKSSKEASAFLREVAEHKRRLLRRKPREKKIKE